MSSPVAIDWSKIDSPKLVLQRFPSRRSVVYGTKGVVSSSQPLATEAGLEILRKGGNAADAAVATSAALNVTEPSCCGIGGDAFCLFFDAKTKQVKALNGSGHSPVKLTLEYARSRGLAGRSIPTSDLNAVTVPGAAAAWVDTVKHFGSGSLSVADVLAPAIRLAEEGVPVSEIHSFSWQRSECPPNGQGITALIALGILESLQEQRIVRPLLDMEHNSAEYLHALVEAMRLAFSDSQYYVTDPDVVHVPVEELLNREYLANRAKLIDPLRTNPHVVHGNPVNSSDTVYFSVTDQWGNACSYIQSNYAGFGTGAVPKGCGFTLQNRGSGFVLQEGHPNMLKGGKRPYHTIIPCMVTKNDELFLSYGVMGGFMQPQGHVQVLLNILRGFTPQAALDAPRFCISAGSPETQSSSTGTPGDVNSEVYFEEGISEETIAKLREMGHDARVATGFSRSMMGRGQVIQKIDDASGATVWAAGSDPRADGHAAAQI
ncbi:gamma-glutamyltranspeptidase [Lentinula edodes]|uniref:Gamma-glutamyltranspeptidase n=1 Tax=Lentinula edodes TaxID=5353 RepID=A0A1Q3EFV0_LENED|nr:gamma-glutamyltranspeptidase [Lentinula edodes]